VVIIIGYHIDDKTKTITDIADLSIEVESTQMNIKQKNKKQNCVTIGVYLLIHPARGFYVI
jgi:hypothetical protein